jgi:hypothetical protein
MQQKWADNVMRERTMIWKKPFALSQYWWDELTLDAMGLFSFLEKKQSFKVTIIPDDEQYGNTTIGITGYRSKVKKLVDDWLCDSSLDAYNRDNIVNMNSSYQIMAEVRKDNEPVDIELDEDGYLIKR